MRYYSDITKNLYDNEKELKVAELKAKETEEENRKIIQAKKEQVQKLNEQRAERAKEVEDAYKIADTAQRDADKLLQQFLADYGSFHSTTREVKPRFTFSSFLNNFFDYWF